MINERKAPCQALIMNLERAKTTPVVQNGFISGEQVAYCLGWKDLVNPKSKPQSVLYNAMGPDVATILLTTNATTIYGIDGNPPSVDKTRKYLNVWDKVDNDVESLPPEDELELDRYTNSGIILSPIEIAARELQRTVSLRAIRGYWDVGEIITWSFERCLMIELKKLGIKPGDLQVSDANGRVQLDFPWAFPGEKVMPRRILYVANLIYDICEHPEKYNLPPLDGYYEKSMDAVTVNDRNDLRDIHRLIKTKGYVLIGRCRGDDEKVLDIEESTRKALGTRFIPLNIDRSYTEQVRQRLRDASRYGWDLYGALKIAG